MLDKYGTTAVETAPASSVSTTLTKRLAYTSAETLPAARMLVNVIGSINFQAKPMSWTRRNRGSVPRTQINTAMSASSLAKNQTYDGIHSRQASGACQPPRKSVMLRPLMPNMPRYSPRKKSANLNPEYSV